MSAVRRWVWLLLMGLLLVGAWRFGGGIAEPRLVEVFPAAGAINVPPGAEVRLRFSRPMQPESVLSRLSLEPPWPGEWVWQDERTLLFKPTKPFSTGATLQVTLQEGATARDFPKLAMGVGQTWTFTVRQPRLAFLYPSTGPSNIYARSPDGRQNLALTAHPHGVLDFTVAPSGMRLYFSARNPQGGSDLYRLALGDPQNAPAGGDAPLEEPEMILACSPADCRAVAVSPDETRLAFERAMLTAQGQAVRPEIWLLSLGAGGEARRLSRAGHAAQNPSWSPQGWLTYYDRDEEAFLVVDDEGRELGRFPNQTGQAGTWQPQGEAFVAAEILFLDEGFSPSLQGLERLADSHLLIYAWPEGEPQDLTAQEGLEDATPAFAPDGRFLAFGRKFLDPRRWTPGRQLWLMDIQNPALARPLTAEAVYHHFAFAWSPAGDHLAYVRFDQSALTEPPQLWLFNLNTLEHVQVVIGGYAPLWIP